MKIHRIKRKRPEITIVPMIDILFIILVYLVVTMETKKARDVLKVEIPTVKEVATEQVKESRSVIFVDALGNVRLDSVDVPEGLLHSYLLAYQNQNPGRKLELEADCKLPLERLLQVWDALTRAGLQIKDVPTRVKVKESEKDGIKGIKAGE